MRFTPQGLFGSTVASRIRLPIVVGGIIGLTGLFAQPLRAVDNADMDAVYDWVKHNSVLAPISDTHYAERKQQMLILDEAAGDLAASVWNAYKATWGVDETAKQNYENNNPILHYFRRVELDTLEEIQNTNVTEGVVVWNMYNLGVIVKTPTKTFGIDVNQSDAQAFADVLDFLIVSHYHDDHFNYNVAQAVKMAGKTVYGPPPVGVATVKVPWGNFDETGENGWKWGDAVEYNEGDINLRFVISYQGVGYTHPIYGKKEPNLIVR